MDVYLVGNENNGSVYVAKYWKNRQVIELTNGTKYADADKIVVILR